VSRATLTLLGLAGAFAALELVTGWLGPYGLFHDELYYWACAKRLGFGYVDHPPLSAWVLAGSMTLLGDGRLVFELVPALCAAGTVVLTGLSAQRMGAALFGQSLAALGVMVTPFMLVLFSFYSVNAIEVLLWTASTFLLVELIRTRDERLWLVIGAVAGIALLNKHTFALLAFGVGVGTLMTPLRAQLRSRWLWLGSAVTLVLALPNIIWNAEHGWPSLAFYRSRPTADLSASLIEALSLQVQGASPVILWVPGMVYLLFSRRARVYRPLGIAFLVLLVVIVFSGQRRADRIAGIYPIVVAAGATLWDQWRGRWHRVVRVTLLVFLVTWGAFIVPATLPVLSPRATADYFAAIGAKPEIEKVDIGQQIPLYFLGRLEWERVAADVMAAWDSLSRDEQERSVVLTRHWVFASVIEYYSRNRRHPPVVAPHNAYWFWRGEAAGRDVVVTVGVEQDTLVRYFAHRRLLGTFRCRYCAIFRPDLPIYVATGPVRPLIDVLGESRYFSIQAAPMELNDPPSASVLQKRR
jgi:4-amino-4-deoxy-L-arabinose transferase-like glycosyltransferase